jgi:hypothetical protein
VQNAIHKQKKATELTWAFFMFVKRCTTSTIETKANWPKMPHSPAPQTIINALDNIVMTQTSFGSKDKTI